MQGAFVLVLVFGAFYLFSKTAEKKTSAEEAYTPPKPKTNPTAATGSNDTLATIISDIASIIGDVREVVDGATDRNAS